MKLSSVAPFAGAWIEIVREYTGGAVRAVAPFAGAWIEINISVVDLYKECVAPFAGAWIQSEGGDISRSLCGSVD